MPLDQAATAIGGGKLTTGKTNRKQTEAAAQPDACASHVMKPRTFATPNSGISGAMPAFFHASTFSSICFHVNKLSASRLKWMPMYFASLPAIVGAVPASGSSEDSPPPHWYSRKKSGAVRGIVVIWNGNFLVATARKKSASERDWNMEIRTALEKFKLQWKRGKETKLAWTSPSIFAAGTLRDRHP